MGVVEALTLGRLVIATAVAGIPGFVETGVTGSCPYDPSMH